jgi:hypothetical protein
MTDNARIRPYIDTRIVILLERLREVQGLSIGKVLTILLNDSKVFQSLIENYYNATDEELSNLFLGLPLQSKKGNNITNKIQENKR